MAKRSSLGGTSILKNALFLTNVKVSPSNQNTLAQHWVRVGLPIFKCWPNVSSEILGQCNCDFCSDHYTNSFGPIACCQSLVGITLAIICWAKFCETYFFRPMLAVKSLAYITLYLCDFVCLLALYR